MPEVHELDLPLADGRTLHVYDTGDAGGPVVYWHHGTPNTGAPPEPLFDAGFPLRVRWISHDRPGYGGSTPLPGRSVAAVVADVAAVVDSLGVERFTVLGHSGGGPHALACAAGLPGRVIAAAAIASPAPYFPGFFDGMASGPAAGLRAAVAGRAAKEAFEADPPTDPDSGFVAADLEALTGDWAWFGPVVAAGFAHGPGPLIDDDLAFVDDWGFDLASITAPTLLLAGEADGMVPAAHSRRLATLVPGAEVRVVPGAGHISVLDEAPAALAWTTRR